MTDKQLLPYRDRWADVLQAAADGLSERQTAVKLDLSPHTVHEHIRRVRRAWGCSTISQAVAIALRNGDIR